MGWSGLGSMYSLNWDYVRFAERKRVRVRSNERNRSIDISNNAMFEEA